MEIVPTRTGWPLRNLADAVGLGAVFLDDAVYDGFVFFGCRCDRRRRILEADQRPVGGDGDDIEVVDLVELGASVSAVPVMPESFLYMRK